MELNSNIMSNNYHEIKILIKIAVTVSIGNSKDYILTTLYIHCMADCMLIIFILYGLSLVMWILLE